MHRLSSEEISALTDDDEWPPLPLDFADGQTIFGPVVSLSFPVDGRVVDRLGPFDFDITKRRPMDGPGGPRVRLRTIDGREIVRLALDVSKEPPPTRRGEPLILAWPRFIPQDTKF